MRTRFAPWLVLGCIGTLVGCSSGDQGQQAGSTELNVVIPSGSDTSGPGAPSSFDIEVVEYTINCTGPDFDPTVDPDIDSGGPLDQDVNFSGALEVLDTASGGVTDQDFGPDLDEVYVWQGFMDIPANHRCSVQLRARDADGEVICTATEGFTVGADDTVKVNILMLCQISYQAPVGMLDLDGDFQFHVANFCPDLFVLNCVDPDLEEILAVPGLGAFAYSGCQVRFRDADSQCGESCDPQVCDTTPQGLDCRPECEDLGTCPVEPTTKVTCVSDADPFRCAIPGPLFRTPCTPEPGDTCFDASGGVACAPTSVLNCGGTELNSECLYAGDTLGNPNDPPPAPLAVGEGGFLVGCTVADNDGDPTTPPVALTPGAEVTCIAVTTDGDEDCDKQKEVTVTCPGDTPCTEFGGNAACQAASVSDCQVGTCNNATCDGTVENCCDYADAVDGTVCTDAAPPAQCIGGECVSSDCNDPSAPPCDDGNECTADSCDPGGSCVFTPTPDIDCAGDTGVCQADGECLNKCDPSLIDCTSDNQCLNQGCDVIGGVATCDNSPNDSNTCDTCAGTSCVCSGGDCISGCAVPPPVDALGIPMACRNSFNQVVSTFPIDLENVTASDCVEAGAAVDFDIEPVIALDTGFLQAAVQTLCDTGSLLTQADVNAAQISIDAVNGATCTETLSGPIAQAGVILDITETPAGCNCGTIPCDSVTVNTGISLPLPPTTLSCSALGDAGDEVQICSTGEIPLAISLSDPPPPPTYQQTYVGVAAGIATVAFACNTSSQQFPAVDAPISCTSPSPGGECGGIFGDVGETPFPESDCDFSDGFPGECETVPVGVDPSTVCATFAVE